MKIKKPLIKVIQIWTLFVFTSLSFLWIISLSDLKISNFWNIKKLNINTSNQVFAESNDYNYKHDNDDEDEDEKDNDDHNKDNNEYDEDDEKENKNDDNYIIPIITKPTQPVEKNITKIIIPNSNCQTITETIYDTITSASWTKSQVPREVSKQVCNNTSTTPIITPITPIIPIKQTPIIPTTIPIVVQKQISNQVWYIDWTYIWNWKYTFVDWSVNYSIQIIISWWKITSAKFLDFKESWNRKYTRDQWDNQLEKMVLTQNINIDTITWATWTSQAIQDSINNALVSSKSIASSENTTINKVTNTLWQKVKDTNTLVVKDKSYYNEIKKQILTSVLGKSITPTKKVSLYKAPNGKTYTIIDNWNNFVRVKKNDWSYTKVDFKSSKEAITYLNKNAIIPIKTTIKKPIISKVKTQPTKTTQIVTKPIIKTPIITTKVTTTTPITKTPIIDTTTKAS